MARILVTEDDVHMLRVLAMWLGRNGHHVLEASNGKIAREILESESVDMIVSDINMPEMNGVELARWLRGEQGRDTPMILLSSRCDQMQIAEELRPLGIAIHPKPFSPSRLMAQIEAALTDRPDGISTATVRERPQGTAADAVRQRIGQGPLAHARGTDGRAHGSSDSRR
ncbi:MAG: response regulator, partial [Planctomycetes bacterium]|nr:response regulator [Planctomycetota bacterium]